MTFTNRVADARAAAPAYVRALLDLLGEREPLPVLRELPTWLERRVSGLEDQALRRPEAPGKWSVIEVLAHLADAELEHGHRTRTIVAQQKPRIEGYDQDAWAREFHYADADRGATLALLGALRAANLGHWEALTPVQLERAGLHSERGRETVAHYLRLTAAHDLVHRRQIERILSRG